MLGLTRRSRVPTAVCLCDRGDRLDDRCHVRVYAHPARDRFAKLPKDFAPFVYGSKFSVTKPPLEEYEKLVDADKVLALLLEVVRNGYGDDLVTTDGAAILTGL